ncbi:MAG: tRNA (adenosine(37)-N6)-dimethylallyltransferase MiaA [Candidatus Omnitrophica bacterium]|nr:tRNA (adenosine(37)-N6)-dimethylallyltransferase MiaA [Candidatus Omnitrophota bacterium]MBU1932967.1 tRNA (adenosine(37)-N6)-dimethylallyltransferase MiaA [Candidatus Omnitrophota bacterium]
MFAYFLVGPTASGKTALSLKLAKRLNAEIISCDSMCVYKGMDILTSKPSKAVRKKIRHHLIDLIPPAREFNVAMYRDLALEAIEDIFKRGKTPLFVGGSGLYVNSVVDGLFCSSKKDTRFRKKQEKLAKRYGKRYLYNKLRRIDLESAAKIHPNNLRYVIRALEIYHTEKKRPSEVRKNREPLKYNVKIFGVNSGRDVLYKNIDNRVEAMFRSGIVNEVKKLSKTRPGITARGALGYKEILGYLKGEYALEEAKEMLKKNTRHFARRQITWFRADSRIDWLNVQGETLDSVNLKKGKR